MERFHKTLQTFIIWGFGALCTYFITQFLKNLIADMAYSTVGGKTVFVIFATLLGAVFLWAILERKIRQRRIKRMEAEIKKLERKIDKFR